MDESPKDDVRTKRLALIRAAAQKAPQPPARVAPRRVGKPRGSTPSVIPRYDGPHRALPNWNYAVLRGGH